MNYHRSAISIWSLVLAGLLILPTSGSARNLALLAAYNPSNHELLDVEISGSYAYVPGGLGGLSIIDIADPEAPRSVGSFQPNDCEWGRLYAWVVAGDYAYGSGRYCGIKVLDVSTPSQPVQVGEYGREDVSYEHAASHGSYLYAAAHTDGVEILDVSVPDDPQLVTTVHTGNAWAVAATEGILYVADGQDGLKIVDVSNPQVPEVLALVQTSGTAKDVDVEGSFVFVAVGAHGVDMFDVTDPANPALVASYNTSGYASRVEATDSLVAVSDWDDVEILRWDDSPSLALAGYKATGGRVMAIHMQGDIVYSAEWGVFRTFRYGPIAEADLDVSFQTIDFPHVDIGSCQDTIITLANNGGSDLVFMTPTLDHADYMLDLPTSVLSPGEQTAAALTYCPQSENGWGTLRLEQNDPDEAVVELDLEGNSPAGVEAGESAPDFTLSSVNGFGDFTLSELQGKVVGLFFFALW